MNKSSNPALLEVRVWTGGVVLDEPVMVDNSTDDR